MRSLDVLYQSSAAYAIPAAVSICSLCENNRDLEEISIWFMDVGLTEQDREGLEEVAVRYGRTIHFLQAEETDKMLEAAGVKKWNESYATFYKIFACSRIGKKDRVLYIDSDTLVLGSLGDLCEDDMTGYACAMAGSGMTGTVKSYLGVKEYYNAGVVHFNLEFWRKNEVDEWFIKAINGDGCTRLTLVGDETLINSVLKGKIKKLPLKYNFESSWGRWGWNEKLYARMNWNSTDACYYSASEIRTAREHPVIGHYVDLTTGRPWDYLNDNPFRHEFEKYLRIVKPWKTIDFAMRGIGGNSRIVARGKWFVKKMMPKKLRSRIAFEQHDSYWKKRISEKK